MALNVIGMSALMIAGGRGGIGKWVRQVLAELRRIPSDFEFEVYVLRKDYTFLQDLEFPEGRIKLIVVSECFRGALMNWLWHQFIWPVWAILRQYRCIHSPSYRRMPLWMPCPMVATIHDLAPYVMSERYDWMRTWVTRWALPAIARRMSAVVAVSSDTAGSIVQYLHVHPSRIKVLYNGVDHGEFNQEISEDCVNNLSLKYGFTSRYWVYVSRIEHPGKNHCAVIEAFELFCDEQFDGMNWSLVFAGADWDGSEVVHGRIQKSCRKDQIHCLGYIDQFELVVLYRGAYGQIFGSLSEGFGIPIIEAMASGVPVIASGEGAIGEIMGVAGIRTDVRNPFAMAQLMSHLVTRPDIRLQQIEAGLEQSIKFNWSEVAAGLIGIYTSCMEQSIGKNKQINSIAIPSGSVLE